MTSVACLVTRQIGVSPSKMNIGVAGLPAPLLSLFSGLVLQLQSSSASNPSARPLSWYPLVPTWPKTMHQPPPKHKRKFSYSV